MESNGKEGSRPRPKPRPWTGSSAGVVEKSSKGASRIYDMDGVCGGGDDVEEAEAEGMEGVEETEDTVDPERAMSKVALVGGWEKMSK
jgi:hypothetical protein